MSKNSNIKIEEVPLKVDPPQYDATGRHIENTYIPVQSIKQDRFKRFTHVSVPYVQKGREDYRSAWALEAKNKNVLTYTVDNDIDKISIAVRAIEGSGGRILSISREYTWRKILPRKFYRIFYLGVEKYEAEMAIKGMLHGDVEIISVQLP